MIKVGTASFAADDTTIVELEDESVCFNSNRDWSLSDSIFKFLGVVLGNISVALDAEDSLSGVLTACAILGFIRIVCFSFNFVSLEILESKIHVSTIATLISIRVL